MGIQLHNHLHTHILYTQGINYLKDKTESFLHSCEYQLQNVLGIIFPILQRSRQSTIHGIILSTRSVANLTGLGSIYKKASLILSRREDRIANIECQILLKLKELSSYCTQLSIDPIPWQKFPEAEILNGLKQQLLQRLQEEYISGSIEKMTKALSYCDDILTLVELHISARTSELSPEELQAIQENVNIDSILSAIEENTGEALGGYTPQILAPIFNDLLSSIPDSHNPLLLVSSSLINTLKKLLTITAGTSALAVTSSSYFGLPNIQRTFLQSSIISGGLSIGLCYQNHLQIEQLEEKAKEITQTLLEIICSYVGMKFFGTDESFSGYFHKIIPAILASKFIETLDFSESYAITPFILSLLVSSIVYNQADIRASVREHKRSLQRFSQIASSGKAKRKFLQPISASMINYANNTISNMLSQEVLQNGVTSISPFLEGLSHEISLLTSNLLDITSNLSTIELPAGIAQSNSTISQAAASISETQRLTLHALSPFFCSFINQIFTPVLEEQVLENLDPLLSLYLAILQQDDMQNLLEEIKTRPLEAEVEEVKNQFLKKVFSKITGKELSLNTALLSSLKKKYEISSSLFTNFEFAPAAIRMLWNSYSYDKKVAQALLLELLLQGFVISGLAYINVKLDMLNGAPPEIPPLSYIKVAALAKRLIS